MDNVISLWKQANEKRNSTSFGDIVHNNGTIVATEEQLVAICEVFLELDPIPPDRRVVVPKGSLLEGGISEWSTTIVS